MKSFYVADFRSLHISGWFLLPPSDSPLPLTVCVHVLLLMKTICAVFQGSGASGHWNGLGSGYGNWEVSFCFSLIVLVYFDCFRRIPFAWTGVSACIRPLPFA